MSAFNTLLNLASLGTHISMATKLEEMRRHGETAAVINAMLNEIRSQIFSYNEAAKNILEATVSPKEAAGAMLLLEMRLKASGLTPVLFPDLKDKEYVSNTTRFIQSKAAALKAELSAEEQQEAQSIVTQAFQLPDYNYYLDHYYRLKEYEEALPASTGASGCIRTIGFMLVAIGLYFFLMFFIVFGNSSVTNSLIATLLIIGVSAVAGGIFMVSNNKKKTGAKELVEKIKGEIDVERLKELDQRFYNNIENVTKLRKKAQNDIKQFFSNSKLLKN